MYREWEQGGGAGAGYLKVGLDLGGGGARYCAAETFEGENACEFCYFRAVSNCFLSEI